MDFINSTNLILIPALYCIGYCLKVAKCVNDNYIPLILISVGAVLGLFNGINMNNTLQGVICAAVAMGIYDTTHTFRREGNKWTKIK